MPENDPQPEAADILQKKLHLEQAYTATHAQWLVTDDYIQSRHNVWDREADRNTRTSRRSNQARVILDHVNDNLLTYQPQWSGDLQGRGNTVEQNEDRAEEYIEALWLDASLSQMTIPAKVWGRNFTKYNYAVGEVHFNPSKIDKGENPFGFSAPHPSNVLLPPFERRPGFAIKREQWYKLDLKTELDNKRDQDGDALVSLEEYDISAGNPFDFIEVVEYFSPDWHALVMPTGGGSGGLHLLEHNEHGIVPFTHAWGGWGDQPGGPDGMDPKYMGQGFLYAALPLIQLLDQVISAKSELEFKAAFGLMVAPEELLERIAATLQAGGNMIPGDVRDVGFMPVQQLPQYLADFQDRIEAAIVRATISTVAFGERPVGVDTVGQHAMMLQVSFKRMVETMEQMAFMAMDVARMWLQILASHGEAIPVRGISLSPSVAEKRPFLIATFPLTDEAVKMNRTQMGAALVQQGLKSKKRHWEEDQGITNVTEEEDQIIREQVRADPILTSAIAEKVRQQEGLQAMYEEQVARMAAERKSAFAETQAQAGLPGFTPPQTAADMEVQGAEQEVLVRPPAAGPGAGQRNGRRG